LAQEARIDELAEVAVDRRAADLEAGLLEGEGKLVGVEMLVLGEDIADQVALLVGEALRPRPGCEVLAELVLGRLSDGDGRKRHATAPGEGMGATTRSLTIVSSEKKNGSRRLP